MPFSMVQRYAHLSPGHLRQYADRTLLGDAPKVESDTSGVAEKKEWSHGNEIRKTGTLADEPGGLHWRKVSESEATYQATKPVAGPGYRTLVFEQRAVRVFPGPR